MAGKRGWTAVAAAVAALTIAVSACGRGEEPPEQVAATDAQEEVVNPCGPRGEETGEEELEGRAPVENATLVQVRAIDYAFEGVADRYEPGEHGFTMVNRGKEFHEMALIRVKQGEGRSIDELLALHEDESEDAYEYVGGTIACPGETAPALGAKLAAGRYALICFIPTGYTADATDEQIAERGENPLHHTKGMTHVFTV